MTDFPTRQSAYEALCLHLKNERNTWLVTGVAGFIGSNLLEALLRLDQRVVGLDNFSTGHQHNLDAVRDLVTKEQWENFKIVTGDIRSLEVCEMACQGVQHVLHQAALGSVPRSLGDPITTNEVNISGFLNILNASRKVGVRSFTYAASSSTYGDHPDLPKLESNIGSPLSPYAVTKYVNELYAGVFSRCYGFNAIGLRYFNVFGRRQDPEGAYAAVIPKWIAAMIKNDDILINGDGETSRDFCYIENVVQANLLAACSERLESKNQVYNVALGERTTLNELFSVLRSELLSLGYTYPVMPIYQDFRAGDVRHSQASISKAKNLLGYAPQYRFSAGIKETVSWYVSANA